MSQIKLGLVAETTKDRESPNFPVKTKQVKGYLDYLPQLGFDIYLFNWRDLEDNCLLHEDYHLGEGFRESDNLRDSLDLIVTRQLGKIYDCQNEFMSFLERLKNFPGIKINNPDEMKKNLDKNYLIELQNSGFPTILTHLIGRGSSIEFIKELYGTSREDVILKPRFLGEGGNGIKKLSEFDYEKELQDYLERHNAVLAQPFMPEIQDGEKSLLYLGDQFSHGLLKRSSNGNYLINISFGAKYTRYQPSKEELELGSAIINHYGDQNHITRIDIITTKEGSRIMEVERVNPATYSDDLNIPEEFSHKLGRFLKQVYERKRS